MDSDRLIAKYFLNQLSAEDQKEFDTLMSSNPEFKERVEFEAKVKKSIFQQEHANLKQQLQAVENSLPVKQNKAKWYLIAASILLLVSIGFYWKQYSSNPETLFADYYTTASNTSHPITRNQNENDTDKLTQAFVAYESEAYDQALKLFNNLYKTSSNSELLFYEGICYLEIGQTDNAIETFLKHQNFNDKLLGKSRWYLALAYLKNNNKIETQDILEKITSSSSNYNFEKAKDLLSDL